MLSSLAKEYSTIELARLCPIIMYNKQSYLLGKLREPVSNVGQRIMPESIRLLFSYYWTGMDETLKSHHGNHGKHKK